MFKMIRTQKGFRHIRYSSVNRRVRLLEKSSYIRKIGTKKTRAGFEAALYELTLRTYMAMFFNSIDLEDLLLKMNENTAVVILADFMSIKKPV